MKLPVKNKDGSQQAEMEVGFELIENGKGTQAVHDAVVAYTAAQRSGNASTKTKGEVAKSGKKPWRQKGTGRARAGDYASPLWRGGGIVFGPKPRDFRKKVPKTTRRLAMRKAISERLLADEITIVDDLTLERPKTKDAVSILKNLGVGQQTLLVVVNERSENLALAMRNIPNVEVTTADRLNPYEVLWPDRLVITQTGFQTIEQRLNKR